MKTLSEKTRKDIIQYSKWAEEFAYFLTQPMLVFLVYWETGDFHTLAVTIFLLVIILGVASGLKIAGEPIRINITPAVSIIFLGTISSLIVAPMPEILNFAKTIERQLDGASPEVTLLWVLGIHLWLASFLGLVLLWLKLPKIDGGAYILGYADKPEAEGKGASGK